MDYTRDVSIGPSSIGHAAEGLRKIRSALRFLLANVEAQEVPELEQVTLNLVSETSPLIGSYSNSKIDQHVLNEFSQVESTVAEAYDSFAFNRGESKAAKDRS